MLCDKRSPDRRIRSFSVLSVRRCIRSGTTTLDQTIYLHSVVALQREQLAESTMLLLLSSARLRVSQLRLRNRCRSRRSTNNRNCLVRVSPSKTRLIQRLSDLIFFSRIIPLRNSQIKQRANFANSPAIVSVFSCVQPYCLSDLFFAKLHLVSPLFVLCYLAAIRNALETAPRCVRQPETTNLPEQHSFLSQTMIEPSTVARVSNRVLVAMS